MLPSRSLHFGVYSVLLLLGYYHERVGLLLEYPSWLIRFRQYVCRYNFL